jgi:hypothetical protein
MRWIVGTAGLVAIVLVVGCSESGQERHRVSGTVKFDGKDIPYGEVLITPDDEKKNSGAQGIAPIRDGRYDTSASGGKGYGGGPAVIRVTGLTGEGGKLLCEYEYRAYLPREDATHEIEVPPQAAPGAKDQKGQKSPEI